MGDSNVATFRPNNGQNLDNIPHMLRWWADAMERGEEPMPQTVLLVLSQDEDSPPQFCIFGKNMSAVALGGTFHACALMPLQVAIQPE